VHNLHETDVYSRSDIQENKNKTVLEVYHFKNTQMP